jgi:hypothetical protein
MNQQIRFGDFTREIKINQKTISCNDLHIKRIMLLTLINSATYILNAQPNTTYIGNYIGNDAILKRSP